MTTENKKAIPKLIYGAVGIAGIVTLGTLIMSPGFGLNMPLNWLLGVSALAWGTTKFMHKNYTDVFLYIAIFVAGLLTIYGLATKPNFGLVMDNVIPYLLAIGGIAWGMIKFLKIDVVKKVAVV